MLLSELELDTSNSANNCLFMSSNSCSLLGLGHGLGLLGGLERVWGSLGLYGIFFLVDSGISMGISHHGIGLCSDLNVC